MQAKKALKGASQNASGATTIEDNFSTYVYTGTGSSQKIVNGINLVGEPASAVDQKIVDSFGTSLYIGNGSEQTIKNGIDLATEGGMVWVKGRDTAYDHRLFDTDRGVGKMLSSNTTGAEQALTEQLTAFSSDGFTVGNNAGINGSGNGLTSWTFKKEAKFFDIVKYTGNGVAGRQIAHNLGCDVGMIIIKRLDSSSYNWSVYHKENGNNLLLSLNTTSSVGVSNYLNYVTPTSSNFTVSDSSLSNANGGEYVAYIYAHDDTADGMIQCGETAGGKVTLGWEPQYILHKSSNFAEDWTVIDNQRGMSGISKKLAPNTSAVEANTTNSVTIEADGFTLGAITGSHIYMAIRKPQFDGSSGGMVWTKCRSYAFGHQLYDTERGATKIIHSDNTSAEETYDGVTSFNTDGFSLGSYAGSNYNANTHASWTFRKAPRFFDVVKYTGNGVAGREIPHNLGCDVGMIVVKRLDSTGSWTVYHKGITAEFWMYLENTLAKQSNGKYIWGNNVTHIEPTDSVFTVTGGGGLANVDGQEYIAYLFAHDPLGPSGDGSDGMIACGSYVGDGTTDGSQEINVGFEPQYIKIKCSSSTGNWWTFDSMRGIAVGGTDSSINDDTSGAESSAPNYLSLTPNGFTVQNGQVNDASKTFIYMAIRRPMKEPLSSDEVFAIDTATATTPVFTSGFPVDFAFFKSTTGSGTWACSRVLQGTYLTMNRTSSDATDTEASFDYMDGFYDSMYNANDIGYMFKRAKGFFDIVAYTGDGVAGRTVNHNLGVVPEMIWVKSRSNSTDWAVWHKDLNQNGTYGTYQLYLNLTDAQGDNGSYHATPTDLSFSLSSYSITNGSSYTYIAYLFATVAGVSKVGSYTGNGTSQTIDCGFTTGAKFVIIKCSSHGGATTGDWWMFDVVRGITYGGDPYLNLNTTKAENNGGSSVDLINPHNSGFTLPNSGFTFVNTNNYDYIYYAVANPL